MRPPLDGTVLVTGASAGIGAALSRVFARTAKVLVLVARREDRLRALADELERARAGLQVHTWACDLADASAAMALARRAIDELGGVDVLVNNAGFGDQCYVEHAQWPKLAELIAVNITALTLLCQQLVPGMVARGKGGVLNISSGFGVSYLPGMATYVASKHYVTGFTDTLRSELAGTGVSVTQVLPGPVASEFHGVARGSAPWVPPRFAIISCERCAEDAVRGFAAGRAMVFPGIVFWFAGWGSRIVPRWLWRQITALLSRFWLRPKLQLGEKR
ncbi:MAG TPA: SDR family NAD(P)-dependent oxidoreductase [Nannocystaceae bacterium]|nr:SDR family NAD(P)-dependent oxidoreductase [Nannocystaceae bacterium]